MSVQADYGFLVFGRQFAHFGEDGEAEFGGVAHALFLVVAHVFVCEFLGGVVIAVLMCFYTLFHEVFGVGFYVAGGSLGAACCQRDGKSLP